MSVRPLVLTSVGVPAALTSDSDDVGAAVTVTESLFELTDPTIEDPEATAVLRKEVPSTSAWVVV